MNNYIDIIEESLKKYLPDQNCKYSQLCLAMEYALMNGGKRIRPALMLEFCKIFSGEFTKAIEFACALEMIHSYSLVHDDLPCMDDDDMRRGKPSCHKKFGESTALLAGDALLTLAFQIASNTSQEKVKSENIVKATGVLAKCAGVNGMVGGQVIDLENEGKSVLIEELEDMDALKTGALIISACEIGCIIAGASDEQINLSREYAKCIGLSFQIVDDILDKTSDTATLGKPVGSDDENNKATYVSILGLEKSREIVDELTKKALHILKSLNADTTLLEKFTIDLANRKK